VENLFLYKSTSTQVGFQVLTAASMKMAVFWDDHPDDGGSKHL
jgi:hypothetical protein